MPVTPLQELSVLLPCHSLEDFPVHHEGEDAESLLAAWTTLWHPALVAAAGKAPGWERVDDPPESFAGRLLVVPKVSQREIAAGWAERAQSEGAIVVRGHSHRKDMVAAALSALEGDTPPIPADLVEDFFALGFGYLQVELLTRQMRYASNVDEVYFQNETLAAATAAARGELDEASSHLTSCFDVLAQARDQFYPVDSYLIDLVLVAPTTIGDSLRRELASERPINLLISGAVLNEMARREPETLAALRAAIEARRVTLIGGEYDEPELPLLPLESILEEFQRGRATYLKHLGAAPQVYGRRSYGLCPALPQILSKLGFTAAVHITFDGARFPLGEQSKSRWEGHDGSGVDMLNRTPLDATAPGTYLNLSHRLGDALDHDHVATLCFARWPGQMTDSLGDLHRVAAHGPALGRFVTLAEYFDTTEMPDHNTRFEADEYQLPYLRRSVAAKEADPISRHRRVHEARATEDAIRSLVAMTDFIRGRRDASSAGDGEAGVAGALAAFAAAAADKQDQAGRIVVNPLAASRTIGLQLPHDAPRPDASDPVKAVGNRDGAWQAVVETPPLGFAWIGPGAASEESAERAKPLAEEHVVRNEFMEVFVNPTTGGIQSIHLYEQRGNLLSQQLAFRSPTKPPKGSAGGFTPPADPYSQMKADSVEVTASTLAMGEITSRGHLIAGDETPLAVFSQVVRLWRGSRIVELEVELDPLAPAGPGPWDSYYAARFAWPDPDAHVWRSAGGVCHPTVVKRLDAVHFIDIRSGDHRVTLLPAGLPFHRRSGERMLDTLLIVRGESARRFRLGIGVDVSPMAAAMETLTPAELLNAQSACPASGSAGWLFHTAARNVAATHIEPLWEDDRVAGFRARLLETSGRSGRVPLSALHPIRKAVQTDYLGGVLCNLPVDEGKAMIDFAQYEWVQVEGWW